MPGVAATAVFVEGGDGVGDFESGIFREVDIGLADFLVGGALGFIGDCEARKESEGREMLL